MLFVPIHMFLRQDFPENSNIDIGGGTSVPNPRANGAKRRSGRKPGARATNFVLAELKVVARDR